MVQSRVRFELDPVEELRGAVRIEMTGDDRCPLWAKEMISQLREVEIFLGNIPKPLAWQSQKLDEVAKRTFAKLECTFDDTMAELVFQKITQGLFREKFSVEEITSFINTRVGYKGGPPYCSAEEVKDSLS